MAKDSFIKRSALTGEKYDLFDDVIRILNARQAAFYVSKGVKILDVYLSSDQKTGEPVLVFLFKRSATKDAYDEWCKRKEEL